jgi:hypothetical protein
MQETSAKADDKQSLALLLTIHTDSAFITEYTGFLLFGTTNIYGTSANLHTLQITEAHFKSSQSVFTSRCLVAVSNNEDSFASVPNH